MDPKPPKPPIGANQAESTPANEPLAAAERAGDRKSYEVETLLPSGEGATGRVRVSGAFPGERAICRIEHIGKHATFATALELERGRMARRVPPCTQHRDVGGRCTGCSMMGLEEADQRALLRDMLASAHGLDVDEVTAAPEPLGYRYSAKRVAFGGPGRTRLGSFVRGTHRPADMQACLVDHPRIMEAADELAEELRALRIPAYDAEKEMPGVRAVWFRTDGKAVLTTLVVSERDDNALLQLASRMTASDGVAVSVYEGEGNALRGEDSEVLRGISSLDVSGTSVGPLGFLQPNPKVAAIMYDWLVEGIDEGPVFDLYAGSGATTKRLAQRVDVTPCESHVESAAALGVSAESAESFLARQDEPPAAIIANPPRKGLGAKVAQQILRLSPARVHIMACGPAGLKRDLDALSEGYELEALRAFDTLPQTPHVELIAKLVRR